MTKQKFSDAKSMLQIICNVVRCLQRCTRKSNRRRLAMDVDKKHNPDRRETHLFDEVQPNADELHCVAEFCFFFLVLHCLFSLCFILAISCLFVCNIRSPLSFCALLTKLTVSVLYSFCLPTMWLSRQVVYVPRLFSCSPKFRF